LFTFFDRSSSGKGESQRQRNLKQKFVALLKKFNKNAEEGADDQHGQGRGVAAAEIEDLFDQLEDDDDFDLSEDDLSQNEDFEGDAASIGSTPKPQLKPFFNSSRNLMPADVAAVRSEFPPRVVRCSGRLRTCSA